VTHETVRHPNSVDIEPGEAVNHSLLDALVMVAAKRGKHLSTAQLCRDYVFGASGPSDSLFLRIAAENGLVARQVELDWSDLGSLGKALPLIIRLKNGNCIVVVSFDADKDPQVAILRDPSSDDEAMMAVDEVRLREAWDGSAFLVKRRYKPLDNDQPFGLPWLMAQVLRERKLFRDVAIATAILTIFGLLPPIVFMIILNRVLVSHSISTLNVLIGGILFMVIFDTIFGYLKRSLVATATARIDGRINLYVYSKLIKLPIDFFERNPTGVIAGKTNEVWRVRQFLTGSLFGTLMDSISLLILVPVMLYLSFTLGMIVLGLSALICLVVIAFLPALARKTGKVIAAEQAQNSLLIESIHGMRTIKSLALDGRKLHEWDVRVARAVEARDDFNRLANYPQTIIAPLEKLVYIGTLAIGTYMAMDGNSGLLAGTLVAFAMIAQRVAAPLVQISHLLQTFEEARASVSQVASVINVPPEQGRSGDGVRKPIKGEIDFSEVRFKYPGASGYALNDVSFKVPQGTIFGIMGRSGSGKTTVTRLLQGLHQNYEGLVKIDGIDLREYDLDHLRQSIGVVLQENFLFGGSIRDNIIAGKPAASFDELVRAARLAGAEEFIERMPRGYETVIEEGSANLSGGQRQRIAIARALIIEPQILVLDEATSALDAESEAIVNENLLRIAQGRTVMIISHRLSSLLPADNILVLERGKVYDVGPHSDLLRRCDIYKHLWHQQNRHIEQNSKYGFPPIAPVATL
jgi:ATP-binding cassette subfamily B protein